MTESGASHKNENDTYSQAKNPPPGPADHGREGGMATREVAPDLVESNEPPD
jgi:hypothetical protein